MDAAGGRQETMTSTTSSTVVRKGRRRLVAWLSFAAVGIATGAVWATGFASVGGATGTTGVSPILAPSAPGAHTPDLQGAVTADDPLTVNWAGRWGSSAATNFFTVDLSGKPGANTYNVAFLLTNDISAGGWTSLQLKLEAVEIASGACDPAAFDGTNLPHVMAFDSQDAGVYWNGLAGAKKYCIGIDDAPGDDTSGTFLRRADESSGPTTYPTFVTTVDRAS
ncbi:MAG: hypothetical protein QOI64_1931 [Solirubrobacteraceae bacterium]|jgi:hypothetical protein|nr:hypothetical protein [Solirubrobacteraceae bacterium]